MPKKQKKASSQAIPIRVTRAKSLRGQKNEPQETGKPSMQDIAPRMPDEQRPADAPAKSEETLSKEALEELLTSGNTEAQDMTKLTKGNKSRRIIFRTIAILLVLFIVALAGFLFFSSRTKKFGQQIMLSIDMPQSVSSGDVVTLSVKYQNNESVTLNDVELTMQFPQGFLFQSSTPANTAPNAWALGKLTAHAGGIVEIRGQVVGDIDSSQTFSAALSYRPENFNYSFEQDANATTTITSSTLSLTVDAPLRVVPDKEFTLKVSYKNISTSEIPKLQIVLDTPNGFASTKVTPDADNFTWKIDKVATGKADTVSVAGMLSGDVGSQKQFTVRAGYLDANGTFQPQTQQTFLILLIKSGLTLSVTPKPEAGNAYAQFGSKVSYTINYVNDGDVPLANVAVTLSLKEETSSGKDAAFIDWNSVTTLDKAILQDSSIVWQSKNVSALADLKPGDKGSFSVDIPLVKSVPPLQQGDAQFHLLAQATASQTSKNANTSESMTTKSDVVETKILSPVTLETEARYYNNSLQKIGSGPLPPTVGSATQYVIFWRVANQANDIKDVMITMTLPTDVTWIGQAKISAGDPITFNPQTRQVAWTVNRIPAGSGTLFPKLEASFTISVTPTAAQAGQFLVLTDAVTLVATDTYVSVPVTSTGTSLTSDLATDPQAKGSGIVVSQ